MPPKKLTIDDIATATGVSKATVSRYLNGHKELMSEQTWDRIKAVIEVSGYKPSDIARNLKKRNTNLIGVSISDITSPFSVALIVGISKCLDKSGYTLLISNSEDSSEKEKKNIDSLISKGASGLLINTSAFNNDYLVETACKGIPIVLCDRKVCNHTMDVVTANHEAGMKKLIQHLKDCGYTRPVLFTQSIEQNSTRMRRRDSFIRFVREIYGYTLQAQEDIFLIDDNTENSTTSQLKMLYKKLKKDEIPAIIGTNSITTVRVRHCISEMGLSIPDEIGICGPEDWDWNSELNWPFMTKPHVTTLKVPSTEIGYQAAQLLLEKLENPTTQPKEISLPCKLNIRGSTMLSR